MGVKLVPYPKANGLKVFENGIQTCEGGWETFVAKSFKIEWDILAQEGRNE
jgi:hypothetical protein